MKRLTFYLALLLHSTPSYGDSDYVAIDPTALETVSGNTLMLISYCIVTGMLLTYWIYVTLQSRRTIARIALLERKAPERNEL